MGKTFTVSEINRYTRVLLKEDIILRSEIIVSGEISDHVLHSSGHSYFTLKEGGCQLRAAFFAKQKKKDTPLLKDGMRVEAYGKIDLYELGGQYQLIVSLVKESGLGILYEQFLKLKEKLTAEGLFDIRNKRKIPFYPNKIAIITSPTGAVLRDIVTTANYRCPNIQLLLYPAAVQGEGGAKSVIEALQLANRHGEADVIIIARGGGSFEDLNCFNDEQLARAIHASALPVISGVGHETDFTIADYAADMRAATPTAAAVAATPDRKDLIASLETLRFKIFTLIETKFRAIKTNLAALFERLKILHPEHLYLMRHQQLDRLYEQISNRMETTIARLKERLKILGTTLEERAPFLPLQRGYAWVTSKKNGRVLRSVEEIYSGETITLHLNDGSADAQINEIYPTIGKERKI